jgi:hypothetical protein
MNNEIHAKVKAWKHLGKCAGTALTLSALSACLGGEGSTSTAGLAPTVSAVTPVLAMLGQPTSFTVIGQNLPLTALATIAGGTCTTPVNRTSTGFTTQCTPGALAGSQSMTIWSDLVPIGWWVGTQAIMVSTAPVPAINALPDTGVAAGQCYGAGANVLISCASAAAIALNDRQDGMVGRDVASAVSTDGQLGLSYNLVATYAKTDCVVDNITGLMWQGRTTALAALAGDARTLEVKTYLTGINTAGWCGFTDWRVPSRLELQSLLNYGSVDPYFDIDVSWFPDTMPGPYYSSTPYAPSIKIPATPPSTPVPGNFWVVDFSKGRVVPDSAVSTSIYVRLVR